MTLTRAAMLAASLAVACSAAQAETFNIQTSFNAGDFSTQYLTDTWLPKIKERTQGRITITLTPNGSVVPAKDTPEAVASGVLDGDFTSVNYFSGREPAYAIMGDLISGYDTPEQMLGFCREGGGEAIMQKAVDTIAAGDVQMVACGPYSKEALPARVPIRTFQDLAGKKIRSPEGLAAAVFKAAGASPVSIPFSEVYGALEKGIVDAADASAYVNNSITGLHDVAPYPLFPGIHSIPSMQFTINKKKWDALSPADQATLKQWWYDAMYAMAAEVDKQDKARAAQDEAGGKIHVINWAQKDRDQLRKVAFEQWEVFAKKSPLATEALAANMAYMTKIGLFKQQ